MVLNKFVYYYINFFFLLITVIYFYSEIKAGTSISNAIIITIFLILIFNIIILLVGKVIERIFDYFIKKYQKKKMKNYNMFEWMGESNNWINLYEKLSEIKEFDKSSIHDNYERIKEVIKKEYNTKTKLESLKLFLEIRVESPRFTSLISATQTILLALITASFVGYLNGKNFTEFKGNLYPIIGLIVWFLLLAAISFFGNQIDKYKLLLKLVSKCIEEECEKDVYAGNGKQK
jgi:hypothetical protein